MDDSLQDDYDIVLLGTGLVQSIVASALSRAGRSVLHVDPHDTYGGLEAVWTRANLEEMEAHPAREENSRSIITTKTGEIRLGSQADLQALRIHSVEKPLTTMHPEPSIVDTPYGRGYVMNSNSDNRLAIQLQEWTLANGTHPTLYVGLDPQLFSMHNATSLSDHLRTNCKISTPPQLSSLLKSHAWALDVTPSVLHANGPGVHALITSSVADYVEFKSLQGLYYYDNARLERVPCSKADVFSSQLLSPLDKRRLMKFLHLGLDYAHSLDADGVEKEENTNDDATSTVQTLNERHLNQGRSLARPQNKAVPTDQLAQLQEALVTSGDQDFGAFLQENQQLSPRLAALVQHALAMGAGSLADGMDALQLHLKSLGRYGTTAFLLPMYGSGELPQAYCRSAAVYGATYLLRQSLECVDVSDDEIRVRLDDERSVTCRHVVLPREALVMNQQPTRRVVRRISLVPHGTKILVDNNGEQRHVAILPPETVGNESTIFGIFVDDSVSVAPRGASVLHWTTAISCDGESSDDYAVLDRAVDKVAPEMRDQEIFRATFSYDIFDRNDVDVPRNLHVAYRTPHLAVDAAFAEAEQIFETICPDERFLKIAQVVQDAVKERLGDATEEDDEQMVLESALGMIQKNTEASSSATAASES